MGLDLSGNGSSETTYDEGDRSRRSSMQKNKKQPFNGPFIPDNLQKQGKTILKFYKIQNKESNSHSLVSLSVDKREENEAEKLRNNSNEYRPVAIF